MGDFNAKLERERIFSNQQVRMRVYMRTAMIMVLA
jgi:hypothetical protein